MTPRYRFTSILALSAMTLFASAASAQMKWTFAPYLWGSDVTARADVNGRDVLDRTANFSSVLDHTDFAGMAYLEGRGERYGFFIDTTFLNTGSQNTTLNAMPVAPPAVYVNSVKGDTKTTLVDAVIFYHPAGLSSGLDVYLGARILDLDQKLDYTWNDGTGTTHRLQNTDTQTNAIAGVRWVGKISDVWDVSGRVDAGAGDARFTWNGQLTGGYWFGAKKNMSVRAGWKYTEIKYESDQDRIHIDSKLELSGPLVGFMIRW
jgi:hypothetical protein